MLKAKIFSTTTMNALISTKKKKNLANLVLKKKILFLFLSLLVDNCILMYLETTILCIYNFLIIYECLFRVLLLLLLLFFIF